jgi:hypothetical protein
MKLLSITSNSTCWNCHGTGIAAKAELLSGYPTIVMKVCSCVSVKAMKPKQFAQEVAAHMKEARNVHRR